MLNSLTQFIATIHTTFLQTLGSIVKDKGILAILIIAPTIYGFFYSWPLGTQLVVNVPTAIIDNDQSNISRNIIRFATASSKINPIVMYDETEAQHAMWDRKIEGYLVIPKNLKHDVLFDNQVKINLFTNGSYALLNKSVSYGFLETLGTVSAGIELKKLMAHGLTLEQANIRRNPLQLKTQAHYNTSEGYGSYIVPAVSIVILQQTLIMAIAMFIATLYELGKARTSTAGWIGRVLAFSLCSWIICLFYFGWVFYLHDFARGGNLLSSLLLILLFSPCVSIIGCLIGLLLKERERCLLMMIFISIPIYFISGVSWPVEGMPYLIEKLRWLTPSTAAVQTSLRLNQMGASIYDVRYFILNIILISCVAFAALCYFGQPKDKVIPK